MCRFVIEPLYGRIGERIRNARKRARLTQESLARGIGRTRDSLASIEAARQRVQVHTLYQIAALLGLAVADLLPPAEAAALVCAGLARCARRR